MNTSINNRIWQQLGISVSSKEMVTRYIKNLKKTSRLDFYEHFFNLYVFERFLCICM